MAMRADALVGHVARCRASLDTTTHTAYRWHFFITFDPLVVESWREVDQRQSGSNILSVLLARTIAFAYLVTIQLQTCIVAHARVLDLFLLDEVKLRDALEELLSYLGK